MCAAQMVQFLQDKKAGRMLGAQVSTDLVFDTLPLQTYTPWGLDTFRKGLYDCSADTRSCRKRQLPLLALRANPSVSNALSDALSALENTDTLEECGKPCADPRMQETIQQIVWNPSSYGAWLNQKQPVLHTIHTWKTVVLPASAILVPILAIVLPFFILRLTHRRSAPPLSEYTRTVFASIKHQLSIPAFLKARHANDRIGQGLELLFVLGSVVMFVSGIWSQIAAARHLRTVYRDLCDRGDACAALYSTCAKCVQVLRSASPKQQRAFSDLIDAGESALDGAAPLAEGGGIAAYGTAWNAPVAIEALRAWIARLDVLVSISRSADICIPTFTSGGGGGGGLHIEGVYHPSLQHSIPNTVALPSHAILTGPNRGGKSTFCRAVTLAVVTAQSWGFAWASRMKLVPFAHILTALDGTGRLGSYSTFEAEIEFAKSVLALPANPRAPVYICMDEIFHSTNARDGVDASRVFLDRLYQLRDGARISIISTHYRELPEYYGSAEGGGVQCLQAVARMREDDTVEYTYKIKDGMSTVSSVRELLRERGLLCPYPASA
jgi:hypothetical protein